MSLNERYVVVDIETTGHSVENGDRIIQIGAVVIERGKIVDTFSSFVNPNMEIPTFIKELTGITDEMVASAPTFHKLIPMILQMLENSAFVAHNVQFDRSFLEEQLQLEGYMFPPIPLFDTVELCRILLPKEESYKLNQLAEQLGYAHDRPHRADSDAQVTATLFLTLLERLQKLPLLTLQQLHPISKRFHSDLSTLIESCITQKLNSGVDDTKYFDCYRQLALKKNENIQKEHENDDKEMSSFATFIESVFTEEKLISVFNEYEERTGQIEMMTEINDSFYNNEHTFIEAGTGVGKSLAYLLPASFYAYKENKPVIISTKTIPLQEQLLDRDLPLLRKILPFPLKAALLKGRGHYLCLRKFEQSLTTIDTDSYDVLLTKALILIWLTETDYGDIEELNLPSGGRGYWFEIQSDAHSDLGKYNPWVSRCFYYRARKRAQQAHLVITNHALLCTDFVHNERILPAYTHVVIDEAHHFEETASDHLGAKTDYVTFSYLLQRLYVNEEDGMIIHLYNVVENYGIEEKVALHELIEQLEFVKEEIDELFRMLHTFVMQMKNKGKTDVGRVRYRYDVNENGTMWNAIIECAHRIHFSIKDTVTMLNDVLFLITEDELSYKDRSFIVDFKRVVTSLKEQDAVLKDLLVNRQEDVVYWIEVEPKGAKNATYLYSKPVDVSNLLADNFFAHKKSAILTSATLSVNGSFDYQEKRLGLTDFGVKKCMIASPFSYDQQVRLLLPSDLPNINEVSAKDFSMEVAIKLWRMAEVSSGKILVLFTAYDMLRQVYRYIQDLNEQAGTIQLIGQGVTSGSRSRLMKMFKESERSILLGTNSFWEGIDLPGDELQTVVIVRLPFSPPDQPLLQAQYEKIKEEGGNPFMDLSLPQAIIRFKQGFGRLIRTKQDRGSVFVFDRRISTTRYGSQFIRSLPDVPVHEDKLEVLLQKFAHFM